MIRKLYYFVRETWEHTKVLLNNFNTKTRPMIQYLKNTRKDEPLTGVEIGVLYGENAVNILNNLNVKQLFCIDIWEQSNVDFFNKLHDRGIIRDSYSVAIKNFRPYMDRVVIVKDYSFNAGKHFLDIYGYGFFDFVYIDGDHSFEGVKKDLETFFPLVKKGGVLGGHDFCNYYISYGSFMGVIRAVTEFCYEHGLDYFVESTDWWIQK